MTTVPEIQPDPTGNYNEMHVRYALDTLELVAICWVNKIVDQKIVSLAFGNNYRNRVREIEHISIPLQPNLRKTGNELLTERQVIRKVFNELEKLANDQIAA